MGHKIMPTNVVVLSAGPNGLGVTRSLYLKGIRPVVITRDATDVVNFSRLPKDKIILPAETEAQRRVLLDLLLNLPKSSIVIPTSDWFVSFLSEHDEILAEHVRFLLPAPQISDMLIDKALETEKVASILPLPATIQKLTDATALLEQLSLPVIIKPRSHQHMVLGSKNRILHTKSDVAQFFQQFASMLEHLIAQEVIPGDDNCQWVCNCFFDRNSDMVQAFSFNRLRLSPSHYGVTSYARSQHNEKVIALSKMLGKALGYVGPAMIEFKLDSRDGEYKYIELNPRLGMCNYFDTYCGINNAFACYQLLSSGTLNCASQMKDNVMFVSLYEDFFARRKDGENIGQILQDYLRNALHPHVYIYFVWWDPMPALQMALVQLQSVFKTIFNKIRAI
jgi:D-aspartate ligase